MSAENEPPNIIPLNIRDPDAIRLSEIIGGQASVMVSGFGVREFDVINDEYVAQTFRSTNVVDAPYNFLKQERRNQIKATFKVAGAIGRKALFNFSAGEPHEVIKHRLRAYSRRFGVEFMITTYSTK